MTHCTKIGADSLSKDTLNAPEFISLICLPKTKSSGSEILPYYFSGLLTLG